MTKQRIYANLCWYDKRSPHYIGEDEMEGKPKEPRIECYCDNCDSGRDRLALEILEMHELTRALINQTLEDLRKIKEDLRRIK